MNKQSTPLSVAEALESLILGKQREIKLSLACILAGGHLLLEDVPGVGKTTLAQGLAALLGLSNSRIQFTSDLLPSEIVGGPVYKRDTGEFVIHKGPIFTQLVIADEINRATPRTQSALLEAMSERNVSLEGRTLPLDPCFTVIATQNPVHQTGTYALPESQLDRFTMSVSLGYPDPHFERQLYATQNQAKNAQDSQQHYHQLLSWRHEAGLVNCTAELVDYLYRLVSATRRADELALGVSPRGGLQWLSAAKAWAFLHGRDFVIPDDIQDVALAVTRHRCIPRQHSGVNMTATLTHIFDEVPVYS